MEALFLSFFVRLLSCVASASPDGACMPRIERDLGVKFLQSVKTLEGQATLPCSNSGLKGLVTKDDSNPLEWPLMRIVSAERQKRDFRGLGVSTRQEARVLRVANFERQMFDIRPRLMGESAKEAVTPTATRKAIGKRETINRDRQALHEARREREIQRER